MAIFTPSIPDILPLEDERIFKFKLSKELKKLYDEYAPLLLEELLKRTNIRESLMKKIAKEIAERIADKCKAPSKISIE